MLATAKVPNLKANHNLALRVGFEGTAVLATTKVPNSKANHNLALRVGFEGTAVLATTKVPNSKANHNGNTIHLKLLSQGTHL